jgi:hypothetical protein
MNIEGHDSQHDRLPEDHMTPGMDLYSAHFDMPSYQNIQYLWYILVDNWVVVQCNLMSMNKQEYFQQHGKLNKDRMVMVHMDFHFQPQQDVLQIIYKYSMIIFKRKMCIIKQKVGH